MQKKPVAIRKSKIAKNILDLYSIQQQIYLENLTKRSKFTNRLHNEKRINHNFVSFPYDEKTCS